MFHTFQSKTPGGELARSFAAFTAFAGITLGGLVYGMSPPATPSDPDSSPALPVVKHDPSQKKAASQPERHARKKADKNTESHEDAKLINSDFPDRVTPEVDHARKFAISLGALVISFGIGSLALQKNSNNS